MSALEATLSAKPTGASSASSAPIERQKKARTTPSCRAPTADLSLFSVSTGALLAEIYASERRLSSGLVGLENAASSAGVASPDASVLPFLDLFESELSRVTGCISSHIESIESAARALLTTTDCVLADVALAAAAAGGGGGGGGVSSTDGSSSSRRRRSQSVGSSATTGTVTTGRGADYASREADKLRRKAQALASMNLSLNDFACKAAEELRSIADEADSSLGTSCGQLARRRLSSPVWSSFVLGGNVVSLLSDVHVNVRAIEAGGSRGKSDKWVAPANFERTTKKYWVKDEKLAEVLFASVAEVPILVYGRSGRINSKDGGEAARASHVGRDRLWDCLATPVNSIYFDNESMSLYAERIKRSEGAQLLRVRWYGDERPRGSEVLFLELKTHHEKWVNVKSVKQRVSICESDMRAMFDESKLRDEWTRDIAEAIVLRASPSLKGSKLNEAVDLLLECRNLVVKLRLRPCVRTKYLRVAFQSSESNSLRLTIDRDITMIDERGAPSDSWCLLDDCVLCASSQVARTPCAVFEVKLSGSDDPPFIQDLECRRIIMDGHKFSKFLTGAAVFNKERVSTLPYWAKLGAFELMFTQKTLTPLESASAHASVRNTVRQVGGLSHGTGSGVSHRESSSSTALRQRSHADVSPRKSKLVDMNKPGQNESVLTIDTQGKHVGESRKCPVRSAFNLMFCFRMGSKELGQNYAQKKPTRVEPKSFFANERTFIQWISAALLMITVAVILFEVGQEDAVYMGLVLSVIGMAVVVYSLFLYFRRVHLLKHGKPYGYVDHLGPVVLAGAILFGVCTMLYYHVQRTTSVAAAVGSGTTITSLPGQCNMHGIEGVSKLEYQPSDALVDERRGILLVPSMNQITALPLDNDATNKQVRIIAVIPGTDFEALVYVDDIVYAISEFGSKSELFAFEWTDSEGTLSEMNRWKIPLHSTAEGLAYVPDDRSGTGKLYIAGGEGNQTHIFVYNVPHLSDNHFDSSLSPVRELNSNLMSKNLVDPRIAAMYYFEKDLYVLHDNARVIRRWDLSSGELVAEYTLPHVSDGSSKQWEGMALRNMKAQNASTTSNQFSSREFEHNGLRGNSATASVMLYLAYDTPPQVWSIAITEEYGGWRFPACAQMQQR